MKKRKVFMLLEVETDAPLSVLRKALVWERDGIIEIDSKGQGVSLYALDVIQAQANVVEPPRVAKRLKR